MAGEKYRVMDEANIESPRSHKEKPLYTAYGGKASCLSFPMVTVHTLRRSERASVRCLVDRLGLVGTQGKLPYKHGVCYVTNIVLKLNSRGDRQVLIAGIKMSPLSFHTAKNRQKFAQEHRGEHGPQGRTFTPSTQVPTACASLGMGGRITQISTFCKKIQQMKRKDSFSLTFLSPEGKLHSACLGGESWFVKL